VAKFLRGEIPNGSPFAKVGALPPSGTLATRVLQFASPLMGVLARPSAIYVRDCYRTMLPTILDAFDAPDKGILVAGTRGIGKSIFGMLVVLELASRSPLVLYEHFEFRLVIIGPGQLPEAFKKLALVPDNVEPGIYRIAQLDPVWEELLDVSGVYLVQDLGDLKEASTVKNHNAKWLLLSSPNADKLKYLRSNPNMPHIFMPLWTPEEFEDARTTVYLNAPQFAGYTAEQVKARFEMFGGVPRQVLESPEGVAEGLLQKAVDEMSLDELTKLFSRPTYLDLPRMPLSGVLLHVVGDGNKNFKLQFASLYARDLLVEALWLSQDFEMAKWSKAVSRIPQLASYRGHVLEANARNVLPTGPKVKVRVLVAKDKDRTMREVTLPVMTNVSFSNAMLNDLQHLARLQYAWPTYATFPTLDAFAVMPYDLFDAGQKGDCIAMFQVTVSSKHRVNGAIIQRVRAKVKQLGHGNLPMALVFITDVNGITTPKIIKTANGEKYASGKEPKVAQIVMHLGADFDKLASYSTRDASDFVGEKSKEGFDP
jgi:hypothetical protein